eukprot:4338853-Alexandrium_andersonii.AAC.1
MRVLVAQELPRLHQIPPGALLQDRRECDACGCTFARSVKADHYRVRMLNTPCRGLLGLLQHTPVTTSEGRAQHSRLLA